MTKKIDGIAGGIFWRGDEGYELARCDAVYKLNKPSRYPEVIVRARSDQDVAAAVRFARAQGLKVAVRSGGHSWVAAHIRDGSLLIDLSAMQDLQVDPASRTAWVNPAVTGRRLNDELNPHGLMAPTGHHNHVGCGGFLLCGGFGWNFRQWGNGCANVEAIELVTADGELIRADETQNQDYFWAARGAGPGFFGAVTRFKVKAYPRPSHLRANGYVFDAGRDLEAALTWFFEVGPQMPPYLEFVATAVSNDAQGNWSPMRIAIAGLAFAQSEEEAAAVKAIFDACPIKDRALMRRDSVPTTLEERYESGTAADPEGFRYAVDNVYTDASAAQIVPRMRELIMSHPTPRTHTFFLYQGQRPEYFSKMALSGWGRNYIATYPVWTDPADDTRMERWAVEQMRRLEPIANGEGQMNDENMQARPIRYLSDASSQRLETLRAKYDPERLFVSFLR